MERAKEKIRIENGIEPKKKYIQKIFYAPLLINDST